jgi:phosphoribosylaminoimidazole-succinocarboxamide synthase
VNKQEMLYEGKAKRIYRTSEPGVYLVEYKDDATAFNGQKKAQITGKGELNNRITSIFFRMLKENGIENHFIQELSATEQLVRQVEIIPIEVVTRNVAAGSLAKRLGLEEGTPLSRPVVEFYFKNDELGDPLINDSHIDVLGIASDSEKGQLRKLALQVNEVLNAYMKERGIVLVDFKLEFGRTAEGEILLADEISPDTCRFWDAETNEKLDKDRFRRDLGGVEDAYKEILKRLGGQEHV